MQERHPVRLDHGKGLLAGGRPLPGGPDAPSGSTWGVEKLKRERVGTGAKPCGRAD